MSVLINEKLHSRRLKWRWPLSRQVTLSIGTLAVLHNKFQELVKKYGFYPELCDTCRKGNLLKIKSKRRFYKSLCGGMTRDLLIKPFFVYKGLSFNSICVTEPGRTVRPADHIS